MTTTPAQFARAKQAQRRRGRRLRWLGLGGTALVLILAAVATWLFGFSSVFATTQVRVTGISLLTEEQVTQAAAVEMGQPLARQSITMIADRVASLAPVAQVNVQREFPHTVVIEVTERVLTYAWNDGGILRWVDASGVVFHEGQELPQGTVVAEVVDPDQRLLADVATVVEAVTPVLGDRITLIRAEAVDQIEIRLADGDTVVWGSAEESQHKAHVLSVLLGQDASVYDVSAPQAPTTR